MLSSTSPASPTSPPPQEASRPSSRSLRIDPSPKPGKSRARHFLSSVSRSRSRPGTPDLTSGLDEELPRRSQSHDALANLSRFDKLPSMSSEMSTRPSPRESQVLPGDWRQDRHQSNLARSLLHKSSRLLNKRRSTNKLRSAESTEESDSSFGDFSGLHYVSKSRHNRGTSHAPELLKQSISDPYNFQHLTHTSPTEARSLQTTNQRDLVSEFSAIRASQRPKTELKGIKAEDIQAQSEAFPPLTAVASLSTDHESPTTSRPASRGTARTTSRPTTRPTTPHGSSIQNEPSLRSSKSVDSFTRLASRSFSSPMPPISPPPRRSSRRPMPLSGMLVINSQVSLESPILPSFGTDSAASRYNIASPVLSSPGEQADVESNASPQEEIAQAVTTPDETAYCMFMPNPPGTPLLQLEDVPEEDEAAEKEKRESRQIRHTKSFPSARHFSRVFASGINTDAAASDPTLPAFGASADDVPSELHRRISRRVSNNGRGMTESWEDGVDFCYEHAIDDEMYEWDGDIEEGGRESQESTPQGNTAEEDPYSSIPDLQTDSTKSAASSSVTVPGIVTPAEPSGSPHVLAVPRDSNGSAVFTLSPSLLIPREYSTRVTHEESYHHSFGPEGKSNYTFYGHFEHDIQRNYSPRSSGGSPLSKQTSRDSLSISRSGSSATRATTHRQSSSIGSVPELVGGKSASREKLPELAPGDHLNVDALRQDFIKAADYVPAEELEAATPPPGTPVKTSHAPLPTPRSRSNSDSAGRMLAGPPPASPKPLDTIGKLQRPTPRMRSSSLAHNATQAKPKGHRTSYSLFPQTGVR